uniref:hypothetical protein n=1 Tax=Amycolatopsis sp. CA-096443 TaxID=3239919 RepID=UPI003F49352D
MERVGDVVAEASGPGGGAPDSPVLDWKALLQDAGKDPDALRDVVALAAEYGPETGGLLERIADWVDWKALLRGAGNDPAALEKVKWLAVECAPGDEALRQRIKVQLNTAKKRAKRLAAESSVTAEATASASASASDVAATAGPEGRGAPGAAAAPVPVEVVPDGSDAGAVPEESSRYDPVEEERAFVRDVTRVVADVDGVDLTREQALAALAAWREHVTVDGQSWHYHRSPGRTAVALGKWLCARYPGLTGPVRLAEDSLVWEFAESNRVMRVLGWELPDRAPAPGETVAEYDLSAQFLGAMRSTRLGDGEPSDLPADVVAAWDQTALVKLPGWVVLAQAPDLSGLPAHAAAAFAGLEPGSVLPTPLAAYLVRNHGVVLDIARAVVWHEKIIRNDREVNPYGPRLERMAEEITGHRALLRELRDGGDAAAGHALMVIKEVYARFSSGFMRSKDFCPAEWLRPDWADMIAATAAANSLRHLDKIAAGGLHPIAQIADGVWFVVAVGPADVPGLKPAGLELSSQPGKWHLSRWGAATEAFAAALGLGRRVRAGKELQKIHDERENAQ